MAEETKSEKVVATPEAKRAFWKRILWIIGIALGIFGGEKLQPVSRILDAVGPAVVDELIPLATPTPTATPVRESAAQDDTLYVDPTHGRYFIKTPDGEKTVHWLGTVESGEQWGQSPAIHGPYERAPRTF